VFFRFLAFMMVDGIMAAGSDVEDDGGDGGDGCRTLGKLSVSM
jgi:hypothetical protein